MRRNARIFVAGHRGLVGSAVLRRLRAEGFNSIIIRTREELDLTDQAQVRYFFSAESPEYVLFCAARVGGILANVTYPGEFIWQNVAMQNNVIHESWKSNVSRLLFLGSNCLYPRECPQPIKEEYFLSGPLEWTNRPYAVAKIAGIEMCWGYNRQYGTSYITLMPVNLYGPGDNFDLETSHVLPAMVRKVHEAKVSRAPAVTFWGTGGPRREFMHSDDVADAALHVMRLPEPIFNQIIKDERKPPILNLGPGNDATLRETADLVMKVIGYNGAAQWDSTKPDGTMRKQLDISRMRDLGWEAKIPLEEGLGRFYGDFLHVMDGAVSARVGSY